LKLRHLPKGQEGKDKEARKKAPPPRGATTIGRKKKKRGPEASAKLPDGK
jgi:hypothetical protein